VGRFILISIRSLAIGFAVGPFGFIWVLGPRLRPSTGWGRPLMCAGSIGMASSIGSLILPKCRNIVSFSFCGMLFVGLLLFCPFDPLCFRPTQLEYCHRFLLSLCTIWERSYK
jgi:hypothetical protein